MKQLLKKSYVSMIQNSIWAKMFRNNFFVSNWKETDVLKDWADACAYFVSSILKIFGLIENVHTTVDGTVENILKYWWKEMIWKKIQIWDILVWEEINGHKHIWFYVWNDKAVSNSSAKKQIIKHSLDYNHKRKIEKVYTNSKISEDDKI